MNGEWLGSRAIRVNWANQKTQTGSAGGTSVPMPPPRAPAYGGSLSPAPMSMGAMSMSSGGYSPMANPPYVPAGGMSYDVGTSQSSDQNTTVYVGNLIPYTTQADLIPLFQGYGYIVEIRMQADRGFAFVKLDSHANASAAIANLQNQLVHGRPIKCSWGKDKTSDGGAGATTQPAAAGQYPVVSCGCTPRLS
jgi:nucleolysin TIA-1/TIAR